MLGHFAHGKNMVHWKQCSSVECPRCGISPEDKMHITQCQAETVNTLWEEAINKLIKWMKAKQSAPQLVQALVDGLQAWRNNTPALDELQVSIKQASFGWDGLLDGWLSLEWWAQQEAYWAQWPANGSQVNAGWWN